MVFVASCAATKQGAPSKSSALSVIAAARPCKGEHDGVRATSSVDLPAGSRDAFIRYITDKSIRDGLSWTTKESGNSLWLRLQKVEYGTPPGLFDLIFENTNPETLFRLSIETCNTTGDWQPQWEYATHMVQIFQTMKNTSP
jgi:hypothetical protein